MIALLAVLAATPAMKPGATYTLTLHATDNLSVKFKGKVTPGDHTFDTKAKVRVDSVKGDRPDVVFVESGRGEFSSVAVRDDNGAPVLTYKGNEPGPGWRQILRGALGRLVVDDEERPAMSKCTDETEAATGRWLKRAVARLNGSQPEEAAIDELAVKCTESKAGTKLEVAFVATVPRATLTAVMHAKGTLTIDPSIWVTQWKFAGPVHVSGTDESQMQLDGTVSSSMTLAR